MYRKKFYKPALFCVALFMASCNTPPEKAIEKKWQAVDIRGSEHRYFEKQSDEEKGILEFTKDGKVNMYKNGMLQKTVSYSMATDGKSVLLTAPNNSEQMPVKILELDDDNLIITSEMFGGDTMVLKAK